MIGGLPLGTSLAPKTMGLLRATAVALALSSAFAAGPGGGGTYPPGVFPTSTKLDEENFGVFVDDAIEDGKTAIIRWIASEG